MHILPCATVLPGYVFTAVYCILLWGPSDTFAVAPSWQTTCITNSLLRITLWHRPICAHLQAVESVWEHLFVTLAFMSPANLTLRSWHGNWQQSDHQEQNVTQHLTEHLHLYKDTGRDKSCLEAMSWWWSELKLWDRWLSKNKGNLFCEGDTRSAVRWFVQQLRGINICIWHR